MSEDRPTPTSDDPAAPFGLDEDGQPIAPYGLTQEGRPKRSPGGRPPGSVAPPKRKASAPPKRKAPPAARKRPPGPDYAGAVMDVARGPLLGLTLAGMRVPALMADAVAIEQHLPPIAEELGKLADSRPEVAAMLDRLTAAGPYAALLGALVPLGLQLAANHGLLRPGMFGTVPPDALIAQMVPPTPEQLAEWEAAAMATANGTAPGAP